MPTIKNQETADLVAHNYCTNGFNKTQAMVKAGYTAKYADTGHGQRFVFGNVRVKEAIAEIMAEKEEKIETDQQKAIKAIDKRIGYLEKIASKGNVMAVKAITGLLKEKNDIQGLHVQRFIDETEREQQAELDDSLKAEAKALAILRNRETIKAARRPLAGPGAGQRQEQAG